MFQRTKISSCLLLAYGVLATQAHAQDTAQIQRVEITGSAIRGINTEGALPITTLTAADIQKTGATNVTELLQALPSMQGFVPPSSSVNGGGAGVTTAALHSLPSKYTLVLLDGHRVAPLALGSVQGGGFGVNLESIPVAAIDRVEVLTDGAGPLYGSDAIAGVVNFILKKNSTNGEAFATYNKPSKSGGSSSSVGVTKGFGDLDTDHFNVLVSFSHDFQEKLNASQRSVSARGAAFPFSWKGTNYQFYSATSNTEPANISFKAYANGAAPSTAAAYSLNPYYTANGSCGNSLATVISDPTGTGALGATGVSCRFNYAATVEDIPQSSRTSGLLSATFKLSDATSVYAQANVSEYSMKARYAPSAQPLGLSPTALPTLYNKYVVPYLTANNLTIKGPATAGYRSVSLGGRTDDYVTDSQHLVLGFSSSALGWDYDANLTISHTGQKDIAAGGYSDFNQLSAAIASGVYDPIAGTGASSPQVQAAILHSTLSTTASDLNTLHIGAQHDLFELPGGMSVIAVGADYAQTRYKVLPSALLQSQSGYSTQPSSSDYPVGGNYGQVPFDASRNNWGVYTEWALPIVKNVDATVSGRYDSYDRVYSRYVFSAVADPVTGLQNQLDNSSQGNKFNAATGKVSLRWTPVKSVLLRGSYGTGFKAPNLTDIAGALAFGGSTSGTYACPFPGSAGCQPGSAQYDLLAGPNGNSGSTGLKPERSNQWTLGFRVEPISGLTGGLDLWDVQIKKQVESSGIAEQVGFANPQQYASLFVNPYLDPAGFQTIAFEQLPFNGGVAKYRGLDWDLSYRMKTSVGNAGLQWSGTQMLTQKYSNGPGLPFNTDLGVYGPDQAVVFRTQFNMLASLQTGGFTNSLAFHFKSGYHDEVYAASTSVFLANPDGSRGASVAFGGLRVPTYKTFDWQTQYEVTKAFQLTVGIKNLADAKPPLSLQTGGGGNAVGFDGRYYDPTGRTFYGTARYKF